MKKILLVEDDIDFGGILKQYLSLHQFTITWVKNGMEALDFLKNESFSICILDVMMPEMDGFSLAEKIIEAHPEIPFVFLTARGLKEDKIKGLKLGADDYIVKPFEAEELILRVQNILNRSEKNKEVSIEKVERKIGKYLFNTTNLTLSINDEIKRITEKEAALLAYLYANKNQLIKREDILNTLWKNDDFFSGRSMDVFLSRLRKNLANDSNIKINSIRGVGLEFIIN